MVTQKYVYTHGGPKPGTFLKVCKKKYIMTAKDISSRNLKGFQCHHKYRSWQTSKK